MILPADYSNNEVRLRYEQIAKDWQHATDAEKRGVPAPAVSVAWHAVASEAMDLLDDILFDRPVTPVR